jgi:hypothetical protein
MKIRSCFKLTNLLITTVSLIFGLTSLSAHSAIITQSYNWNTFATFTGSNAARSFTDNLNDITNTISIAGFDSSLGTLNGITLQINGGWISSARANFEDPSFFGTTSGLLQLSNTRLDFTGVGFSYQRALGTRTETCNGGSSSGRCEANLASMFTGINTTLNLASSVFGNYTDQANIQLNVAQYGNLFSRETQSNVFDNDGVVERRTGSITSNGSIRVVFNYTAQPPIVTPPSSNDVAEPSLIGMAGLSLLSIGFIRRRNNKK